MSASTKCESNIAKKYISDLSYPVEGITAFTDGSKMGADTGCGGYISDRRGDELFLYMFSCPMGIYSSIAQAETYAIIRVAEFLLSKSMVGEQITIFSDSK